jgi:two-component system response regulator YesN
VISYIHKNIEHDVSRSDIAEHVFLNPEYLSRLFKKEKGVLLKDFIIEEKLKIAQSLLTETNIPISLVASKVGYSNFSNFSQIFKKVTGQTPAEFRKTHRNK